MRAHLLLIKLPYSAEALQPQLEALVATLPQGTRRVLNLDVVVGFLVPYTAIADIQAVRWSKAMRPFLDCWIIGLNGELACKKSNDPFRTWMNEYRRTGAVVEMEQPDDVPLSERGQKRIEPSVHDLIERTFGQVRIKLAPKGERPK